MDDRGQKIRRVTALGFFDGLHLGHQAVIRRAVEIAAETGAAPCILTFDRRPKNVARNESAELLTDRRAKAVLAAALFPGVELIELSFDANLKSMQWQAFATEILQKKLNTVCAVSGRSFRFGQGGCGTPPMLRRILAAETVGEVHFGGRSVSSTRIRALIRNGEIEAANRLLGHPHTIVGPSVRGDGRGRQLGFATLNLDLADGLVRPRAGVYVSAVRLKGRLYRSITNFGTRPTFYENGVFDCETHIFDFNGQSYGEEAELLLYAFIREERRFSDRDALVRQITADVETAKRFEISDGGSGKGESL